MDACAQHSAVEERLDRDDARLNEHDGKIDRQAQTMQEISVTLAGVSATLTAINESQKRMQADSERSIAAMTARVEALESVPARRWDTLIVGIMSSAITAAVTITLPQIVH